MLKLIITFASSVMFLSCQDSGNFKKGNHEVITNKRKITEDFNQINIEQAIDVEIEQAEKNSIEIQADSNLIDHIKTTIDNGILTIRPDITIQNPEKILVIVKTKQINRIETTSASSLKSLNTLKGKRLEILAKSASEININAEFEEISIETVSSSEVTIKGKTLHLDTKSASASEINASELLANEVNAHAVSASETEVHAIVKLNAKASSAASITSNCKPRDLRGEETSGGTVSVQ